MDPIQALLAGNWGAVTGWSLWIGETVTLLFLVLSGRLRPGSEFRKLETTVETLQAALTKALEQNTLLIQANEIVSHFFKTWLTKPIGKRKSSSEEDDS